MLEDLQAPWQMTEGMEEGTPLKLSLKTLSPFVLPPPLTPSMMCAYLGTVTGGLHPWA